MNVRHRVVALLAAVVLPLAVASQAVGLGYPQPTVVSADPVNTTPQVLHGTVRAIATVGSRVYVGGTFRTVVNTGTTTRLPRHYLFAFNRTSGKVIAAFRPRLNGAVESIAPAPDGRSVIVGGRFTTVNGSRRHSLVMLSMKGTPRRAFAGRTNGYVNKILVRGNRLIAGGRFSTADGVARANLVVLNATTGALRTAFKVGVTRGRVRTDGDRPAASVVEMDADAAGSRLVVVGNFRRVGGRLRQQIAMIDLASNTVADWHTSRYPNGVSGTQAFGCYQFFNTQMRDVEFSPDGTYFVVVTTGGGGDRNAASLCDTAARWETNPTGTGGAVETWKNCTGGDTLLSVATTGSAVYVGGHQRWLDNCGGDDSAVAGSFAASGIGAIDPGTGEAIRTWNPGRRRGVGAEELVANADGLSIGSDTTLLGGEYHARLGRFPL